MKFKLWMDRMLRTKSPMDIDMPSKSEIQLEFLAKIPKHKSEHLINLYAIHTYIPIIPAFRGIIC